MTEFKLTGNPEVDEDHRKIFELYDTYLEFKNAGNDEEIKRIFYEMLDYLTFHFLREEELMKNIGFPELATHKQIHFQLQEVYLSLVQPVLSGKSIPDVEKFMELMKHHIETHDSKISSFIEEQNK